MKSISELKKMIIVESQIKTVMDYFFDLEETGFLKNLGLCLSQKDLNENPELTSMFENMQKTLKDFLKKDAVIKEKMICHIPNENFYHGIFMASVSMMPGFVIYFSDIKIGVFSVTKEDMNSEMFRFSLSPQNAKEMAH